MFVLKIVSFLGFGFSIPVIASGYQLSVLSRHLSSFSHLERLQLEEVVIHYIPHIEHLDVDLQLELLYALV